MLTDRKREKVDKSLQRKNKEQKKGIGMNELDVPGWEERTEMGDALRKKSVSTD